MINNNRIKQVIYGLLLTLGCITASAQPNSKLCLRVGLIADPQYADKDDHGLRLYRSSLEKANEAVATLNKQNVNLTMVVGDLVDQGTKDLKPILTNLTKLDSASFNLLGNHDFVDVTDKKNLHQVFDMPAPYYSLDKNNWKFILLNTNELSNYATEAGSSEFTAWETLRDSLKSAGRKNAAPWNGGIGAVQIQWLKTQLNEAQQTGQKVIIFTHHPLLPENGLETLNNREILGIIKQYPYVKAVISGHHHEGNFAVFEGIPLITLEGMVETKENAFGVMDIYEDYIEIKGYGRLKNRVLKF